MAAARHRLLRLPSAASAPPARRPSLGPRRPSRRSRRGSGAAALQRIGARLLRWRNQLAPRRRSRRPSAHMPPPPATRHPSHMRCSAHRWRWRTERSGGVSNWSAAATASFEPSAGAPPSTAPCTRPSGRAKSPVRRRRSRALMRGPLCHVVDQAQRRNHLRPSTTRSMARSGYQGASLCE